MVTSDTQEPRHSGERPHKAFRHKNIVCKRVSFGTKVDIIKLESVLMCFYCVHCKSKLQDSVKFQLKTYSLFSAAPELVLKPFLTSANLSLIVLTKLFL